MNDGVTVIIPTLGTRPQELERAIDSVTSQLGVKAIPLVIVNGCRYEADLVTRLERTPGLCCHRIERAGVSNARLEGRRLVETSHFAFLDDDDELLADALRLRLDTLQRTNADVVVTNGYREENGERRLIFSKFDRHPDDPARALLEENWLASAGGLFRTDIVGEQILDGLPDFLEMTFIAFLLTQRHVVFRLNRPTFIIHAGAAEQASESWAYLKEMPMVLQRMQSQTTRKDLQSRLKQRRAAALHQASTKALGHRNMLAAWKYHLHSLAVGDGLRYLPYTRHIVLGRHPP
ncbi:MAG: glycosyltransferase [Geminicoccaceae bacterium]